MANPDDPVTARLAALESELASLRAQRDEAHAVRDLTMRGQGRCRACHGDDVLRADHMLDRSDMGIPEPMSVAQTDNWKPKPIGGWSRGCPATRRPRPIDERPGGVCSCDRRLRFASSGPIAGAMARVRSRALSRAGSPLSALTSSCAIA